MRPQVASFLCNGEVYYKVCSQITQKEKETDSFWSMIQELSNVGYYVIDTLDEAVTEERLLQQDTFDLVCRNLKIHYHSMIMVLG